MIRKNDVVRIMITDQTATGEGLGKVDSFPLFVKHAVIGDEADVIVTAVKKTYGYGRIKQIIKPSRYRVEPKCPVWKRCGGCQLLSMSYEGQLEYKTNKVREALRRIGGLQNIDVEPAVGSDLVFGYRNKAQYPVGKDKNGEIVSGFYAGRTHEIIPNTHCALAPEDFGEILDAVIKWMKRFKVAAYDEVKHTGVVRHVFLRKGFKTGEISVCLIINARELKHKEELIKTLSGFENIKSISISVNLSNTNVIMGDDAEVIYGKDRIEDLLGDVSFLISPMSFYQINHDQTEKLYNCVKEFAGLKGSETVWDLYCGIGTISLFLAGKAGKIVGIEVVERAVEDAKENACRNNITNAKYYAGDVQELFPKLYKEYSGDENIVIIDPPRKGSDEKTLATIVELGPEKMIYVSCDPATLARDLKYMTANGYEVKKVRPYDLFPNSVHIETVVQLCKGNKSNDKVGAELLVSNR